MSKVQSKSNYNNVYLHVDVSFLNDHFKINKIYSIINVTLFLNFSIMTLLPTAIFCENRVRFVLRQPMITEYRVIGHDINIPN